MSMRLACESYRNKSFVLKRDQIKTDKFFLHYEKQLCAARDLQIQTCMHFYWSRER